MSGFRNTFYRSVQDAGNVADTSALRCVGCVHVLTGLVTFSMGIVSAALYVYLGWLCVGVWTGFSFLICGVLSIMAGKSSNMLTVVLMACTNVLTLNFACTGAVIAFSSLFPGTDFYTAEKGGHSIVHNQTTGTALGILYLVVAFIEIVVCFTSIRISWRILSNSAGPASRRRADAYDEPYLSSNSYSTHAPMETRHRRASESVTPPPDYDSATVTHTLSTSPKSVVDVSARGGLYGSLTEADTSLRGSGE